MVRILDKLKVRRFSLFQELDISHIGMLNLIVGRNNVGKTQLLKYLRSEIQGAVFSIERQIVRETIVNDFINWWHVCDESMRNIFIQALQQIDPDVQTFDYQGQGFYLQVGNTENQLLPLIELSDGYLRIIQIIQAIDSHPNTTILIDEIENGLHMCVYSYLFAYLNDCAIKKNNQFFITTHSYDVIRAFAQCWKAQDENFFAFIRLYKKRGIPQANEYTREDLWDALVEGFDVR